MNFENHNIELQEKGYSIIENVFSDEEIENIISCINKTEQDDDSFLKTNDLFAIRQLLNTIPSLTNFLFNTKLNQIISTIYKTDYFLTKAIYFDKPPESNWFVAYHQDISISVDQKSDLEGYKNWTFKKGQFGVQPPLKILEDTLTIRIHLDDTEIKNGTLKVIPKSHLKGIIRHDSEDWNTSNECICNVKRGGVMLMKPLTLHASNRTTNNKQRRVIHLEFNKHQLENPLQWLEYTDVKKLLQQS